MLNRIMPEDYSERRQKYTYKWIDPKSSPPFVKKIRFTRGAFLGWSEPMGLANVPYAIFRTRRTEVLIPKYDLTPETLASLAQFCLDPRHATPCPLPCHGCVTDGCTTN